MEEQLKLLTEQMQRQGKVDSQNYGFDDLPDDDIITRKELKQILAQKEAIIADTFRKREESELHNRVRLSHERAQERWAVGKVPKGLDYETVMREGYEYLCQYYPEQVQVADKGRDPAGTLYNLAKTLVPSISKRFEASLTQKTIEGIKKNAQVYEGETSRENTNFFADLFRPEKELKEQIKKDFFEENP